MFDELTYNLLSTYSVNAFPCINCFTTAVTQNGSSFRVYGCNIDNTK